MLSVPRLPLPFPGLFMEPLADPLPPFFAVLIEKPRIFLRSRQICPKHFAESCIELILIPITPALQARQLC